MPGRPRPAAPWPRAAAARPAPRRTPAAPRSRRTALHRGGHVDVEELGDVRRGERAGHHGRRGRLAHAPDRDPLLARAGAPVTRRARQRRRWPACRRHGPGRGDRRRGRWTSSRVIDAVPGRCRVSVAQVDAEVLGELADRRLGQRPDAVARFARAAVADGPVDGVLPAAGACAAGRSCDGGGRRGRRDRRSRRAGWRSPRHGGRSSRRLARRSRPAPAAASGVGRRAAGPPGPSSVPATGAEPAAPVRRRSR